MRTYKERRGWNKESSGMEKAGQAEIEASRYSDRQVEKWTGSARDRQVKGEEAKQVTGRLFNVGLEWELIICMRIPSLGGNFSSTIACQRHREPNGPDAAGGWKTLAVSCRQSTTHFHSSLKCNIGTLQHTEHTHVNQYLISWQSIHTTRTGSN